MDNNNNKDKDKDEVKKKLEELRKQRKENQTPGGGGGSDNSLIFLGIILFIVIISSFLFKSVSDATTTTKVEYTQLVENIKNGLYDEVEERDDKVVARKKQKAAPAGTNKNETEMEKMLKQGTVKIETDVAVKITNRIGDEQQIMDAITASKTKLKSADTAASSVFWALIYSYLPFFLLIGFFFYATKKLRNSQMGSGGTFGFGKTKVEKNEKKIKIKFDDVAGADGAKEELKEVVDFLKSPDKYTKAGARVPKGVMLVGSPGTGKTLLAKAVAGESGASFFSISGSEFIEMFVGVGASRVRDLFEKAKKNKPSIIFIDEIDAVGRKRGSGSHGGNEEREQTLNQLLVEMDGFETDENIIVIAATNRDDVLDPALMRAGRFDRKVTVDPPDLLGRIAILKVHSRNKKLSDDVSLESIAKITPGFVGADLENLLNESAILAARENREIIHMKDLDEAVDKIGMGLANKGRIIKPEEKKLLAYHEAGHALVTELLANADHVHKVTIIPRGSAGGFMMPLPEEKLVTGRKEILDDIKVLFGGRASEELVLDDISTGASNDIKRATQWAKIYVTAVGMSSKFGPVNLENDSNEYGFISNISDETIREVDLEIREILNNCYEETKKILTDNMDKLTAIANLLLEKETITGAEVRTLIYGYDPEEGKSLVDEIEKSEEKIIEAENSEIVETIKEEENKETESKE